MVGEKYLGADIKKLGFGLMRLPEANGEIDIEQTKKMADYFIENGFTYFDTAYGYMGGKSEEAAKECVVSRYPRESFQLTTKLPIWEVRDKGDLQRIVDTQLKRTGAGYFDFYLLHSIDREKMQDLDRFGAWEFLFKLREKGVAKHVGFSFHDTAETLDKLLMEHPEVEFVQLQINYADWNDKGIQSRLCYETARRHNKPVIVMEPVKGGVLTSLPLEVEKIFKEADPNASVASWAIRFAASLDGIIIVLSGMSNIEQMRDNVGFMKRFKPLDETEKAVINKAAASLFESPLIQCTFCKYCIDECPQGIPIPQMFAAYNLYKQSDDNLVLGKKKYNIYINRAKASDCLQCGACEGICPQHLGIIENLSRIAGLFE